MRASTLSRKATTAADSSVKKLLLMRALLASLVSANTGAAPGANASFLQRAQHAGTVITVVVIGVVSLVGILIFAQVEEAMPELETDHPLDETMTSITEGFGSALEFVPIIMLVLLAAIVIAVVQRMR